MKVEEILDDIYDKLDDLSEHPDFDGTTVFLVRKYKVDTVNGWKSGSHRSRMRADDTDMDKWVKEIKRNLKDSDESIHGKRRWSDHASTVVALAIGIPIGWCIGKWITSLF